MNRRAFLWGRRAAHDPAAVEAAARPGLGHMATRTMSRTLDDLVTDRVADLTRYQNAAYAARYKALVDKARAAESARAPGMDGFAAAVARYAHKAMAYKDEYEVARLYTDGDFLRSVREAFEGDYTLRFHLAPPLLAPRDPVTGELQKREFGPATLWAFRALARLKALRGTALDPFGRTAERKAERAAIARYAEIVDELCRGLDHDKHALAVEIASVPEHVRGYGHVKERHVAVAAKREAELLAAFRAPAPRRTAAE